jgi:hypothetical protein
VTENVVGPLGVVLAAATDVRWFALLLFAACAADRTLSEQPPFRCDDTQELFWEFPASDESQCIAERPAFLDCDVSLVHKYGEPDQTEVVLPACDRADGNEPCWRADDAAAACNGVVITIDHVDRPAADDALFGWCFTCGYDDADV